MDGSYCRKRGYSHGIYYVENHNSQCSYAELARDFQMAADLVIETYQKSGMGELDCSAGPPSASDETLELRLKALFDMVGQKAGS